MIEHAYTKVVKYLIASDFVGYDPYDGASSNWEVIRENKLPRIFSTYFNKFSPVNFRPLLKIKKSKQNQALAFIGRAMLHEYDKYHREIRLLAEHLIADSLIDDYGYHCWDAHGFPIQLRSGYKPVGITDIIGTEAIGRFFYELDARNEDDSYRYICISICDFIEQVLRANYKNICHYRYTPDTVKNSWCYNASIIAALYVARVSKYYGVKYDQQFVNDAILDIISRQKQNGAWFYSLDLETGYEKEQVDFHQGFILDALLEYMELNGFHGPYLSSYKKGLEFYHHEQFLPDGQGIYRYPRKYPVNIQNQAQGIITFTRAAAAGFGAQYLDFARTIAEWTINNMQDQDGHFYYLKYPFMTNKIPYIRWSDSSMAYALAIYLKADKNLEFNENITNYKMNLSKRKVCGRLENGKS